MQVLKTAIPDVAILIPAVIRDERGFFYESFNERKLAQLLGDEFHFVQDNHSKSEKNVIRGLHYQIRQPQGKLVRVIAGAVLDVVVDLRKNSETFGLWVGEILSAENQRQLWVPPGFAHGFLTLSNSAELLYKTTDYWAPQFERCIRWDDPVLNIDWGLSEEPILSDKDRNGISFQQAEVFS